MPVQAQRWLEPNPLARAQGTYFLLTGLWPIVHRRSFEAVTGPKRDFWLVRTVGALIAVVGASLLRAFGERRVSPEARWLAVGSAAALGAVDLWYGGRGRISRIYLLDAVVEAGLVASWWVAGTRPFHHPHLAEGMPPSRVHSASVADHVPIPDLW
jgi:hypothetical protein